MARRPGAAGRTGSSSIRLGTRLNDLRGRILTTDETDRIGSILANADRFRDLDLRDFIIVHDPIKPPVDVISQAIKPRDMSTLIAEAVKAPIVQGKNPLHHVTGIVMERLRDKIPGALPGKALDVGAKGAELPIQTKALTQLVQLAAKNLSEDQASVIWDDGVNQLVVHINRIKVRLTEGRVEVTIPTEADKLRATMTVSFATGSQKRVAGLVMSTLDRPAGNAVVAQIWGDALIALAHRSLLGAVESLAGASGRDKSNNRLIPRALSAKNGQLTIQSQARFALKGRQP